MEFIQVPAVVHTSYNTMNNKKKLGTCMYANFVEKRFLFNTCIAKYCQNSVNNNNIYNIY